MIDCMIIVGFVEFANTGEFSSTISDLWGRLVSLLRAAFVAHGCFAGVRRYHFINE